ncbi:lipopolysaccharide biosynthesis protein [uncultured Thomasclavelia sp.]|uniref:lipopolysaccharide biosynthesis protein n=1 Tax=uncultured Thomasclavelia sp. TaxID=3025759 RepID=UPI002636E14E|nr:lipopolysaccharide biosynthesis protein [uncultured Thomasclavelia sp.]
MENNLKKNTIWHTIGLTLNSFNSLFFLIIVNRINGVNIGGIFSFAFSLSCLLYMIAIYSGRTYQVSDVNKELNDYDYLLHKVITCLLMMAVAIIFISIKNYTVEKNIIIIILCLYKCLEAFSETFYGYLQKNGKLYVVGKSLFFKSLIGILIFFVVDVVTRNIILSSFSLVVINILFAIFYDVRKSKKYISNENIDTNNILKLFKKGFSVFSFSFLSSYVANAPKYIIDMLLSDSFQNIFGIIIMPGTVMSLCGQYIMAPLLTDVVDCYNRKMYIKLKNIVFKMIKILICLGIFVELVAYILGIPVLNLIYGINLNNYRIDLILIIFGAIFYAISGIFSTVLITMRKNNMQLVIYILSSLVITLSSYLLVINFGIHGATYAYVVTMVFHALTYFLYFMFEYKKLKS